MSASKKFWSLEGAARGYVRASRGRFRGAQGGWIYRVDAGKWTPVAQGYGCLGAALLRSGRIERVDGETPIPYFRISASAALDLAVRNAWAGGGTSDLEEACRRGYTPTLRVDHLPARSALRGDVLAVREHLRSAGLPVFPEQL